MITITRCCLLAALGLLAYGCGDSDEAAREDIRLSEDALELLRYVPADTPYLMAMLEPMPSDVMTKLEPAIDTVLRFYGELFATGYRQLESDARLEALGAEDRARAEAVLDEIVAMLSVDGLDSAGLKTNTTMAAYGHGLLPVMRVRVANPGRLEKAVARMEDKAGKQMPTAELDGHAYRYIGNESMRFVMALINDQLVLSVVPTRSSTETLAAVLGLSPPASNLGESDELVTLLGEQGYLQNFVGFFDTHRIVETFLTPQQGLNADLLREFGYDHTGISEVCRNEIRELAGIMPHISMGYTRLDSERLDTRMVMELRDDLAAGMTKLSAPVPGLGSDMGGAFAFGMSFDLRAMREFMLERIQAMQADPFECELFAELQRSAASGQEALNQPIPPIAYSFKGFALVLETLEGLDLQGGAPQEVPDVRALVVTDNPRGLLAMGQMFSPELAQLDLPTDGSVVEVTGGTVPGMQHSIYLALDDNAIALAVGEGLDAELPGMLAAETPAKPPVMTMSYDYSTYVEFVSSAVRTGPGHPGRGALPPDLVADFIAATAEMADRISMDVLLTEQGVEMQSRMTW